MEIRRFDDQNIQWRTLAGFENFAYFIYDVDEKNRTVDFILKLAANKKIALHNHCADYTTLVIQGELRLYRANGELKEVRPVGSFVSTAAGGESHTEGGGDQEAIVYYSNRNVGGLVYEFLDREANIVATLGLAEFKGLLAEQTQ
jgi:2,4'-dihydroxyacetophenone dioxygenase